MATSSGWWLVNGNPVGVAQPNTSPGPQGQVGTVYSWLEHDPPLWLKTTGMPDDTDGWQPISTAGGQPVEGAAPVFVDDDITYLTTDNIASYPTADIDVRFTVRPKVLAAGTNQAVIAQTDSGTTDKSFYVFLNTAGRLAVNVSANGVSNTLLQSSANIPGAGNGVWMTCRVTVDADNGAGSTVATFYTSPDRGATWTQYQQVTVAATGAIHRSTQPMYVATSDLSGGVKQFPFFGAVLWVELRDGIGGGVVAAVDYRGDWTGSDGVGNTWTLTGTPEAWALNPALTGGGSVDLSGLMSNSLTVTAPGAAVGYWGAAHLNFAALAAGSDPEPLYVETKRGGSYYRSFWLNENGSPRGAAINDEPALKLFGPSGNLSYTGLIAQVLNHWSGTQTHIWGVHTDGRYRIGSGLTPSAPCIVLAAADPVPAGIPVGTLIFRTP